MTKFETKVLAALINAQGTAELVDISFIYLALNTSYKKLYAALDTLVGAGLASESALSGRYLATAAGRAAI